MRLLINIRGCNGAGKSSIPMSLMDDPDMFIVSKPVGDKMKKLFTVFPSYNIVALGTYFNKTGGCDGLNSTELVKKALRYALRKYPDFDILFEGVIISTVYSTWRDFFFAVTKHTKNTEVLILNLVPPLDTCLERIQQRTGKPIKEELVASKWDGVLRNHSKFQNDGLRSTLIDNSTIDKTQIKSWFLDLRESWRSSYDAR